MRHKEISHDNPIFSDQYLSQTKIFSSISSLNFLLEAISSVLVEKHFDEIHFCYLMSNEGRDLPLSLSPLSICVRASLTCWAAEFVLPLIWRAFYWHSDVTLTPGCPAPYSSVLGARALCGLSCLLVIWENIPSCSLSCFLLPSQGRTWWFLLRTQGSTCWGVGWQRGDRSVSTTLQWVI